MEVPRYPTFETRMSSGPRRSPAPAISAGRGDGPCCHGPLPADAGGLTAYGRARRASPQLLRSPGREQDMHMHPYVLEELARQRERELRRWAERYGQLRSRRLRQGRPARRRAGRALAGLGLALARR